MSLRSIVGHTSYIASVTRDHLSGMQTQSSGSDRSKSGSSEANSVDKNPGDRQASKRASQSDMTLEGHDCGDRWDAGSDGVITGEYL